MMVFFALTRHPYPGRKVAPLCHKEEAVSSRKLERGHRVTCEARRIVRMETGTVLSTKDGQKLAILWRLTLTPGCYDTLTVRTCGRQSTARPSYQSSAPHRVSGSETDELFDYRAHHPCAASAAVPEPLAGLTGSPAPFRAQAWASIAVLETVLTWPLRVSLIEDWRLWRGSLAGSPWLGQAGYGGPPRGPP